MSSLVQTFQGRPAVQHHEGGVVYVAIHDAYFIREQRRWKALMSHFHPDAIMLRAATSFRASAIRKMGAEGRLGQSFRNVKAGYETWLERERRWYSRLGMEPPGWGRRRSL